MKPSLLTAHQSAHFSRAGKIRVWMVAIQFVIAFAGALSVLIAPEHLLYMLAIIGAALSVIWWVLKHRYDQFRTAAQGARRAGLIANGLDGSISASAIRDLQLSFNVSDDEARKFENPKYYETKLPPGWLRIAEMLEESAFYTAKLQGESASVVRCFVAFWLLFSFGAILLSLGSTNATFELNIARIAIAFILFLLTGDVLGSLWLHAQAARDSETICQRLSGPQGKERNDIILCLLDYNAVVESAPEVLPYIYKLRRAKLDGLWTDYQASREENK